MPAIREARFFDIGFDRFDKRLARGFIGRDGKSLDKIKKLFTSLRLS